MPESSRTPESILHSIRPEFYTHPIVQSSARQEVRRGGGTPGRPVHKLGAFIGRIDTLLDQSEKQDRLVEHISNSLLVQIEDIPESFWQRQVERLHDNGHDVVLEDVHKELYVAKAQEAQRVSIEAWTEHLVDNEGYPSWFKVYAIDGMSKLGAFDREKGRYAVRRKDTIVPYPVLNPEALALTYDAVRMVHQYGLSPDFEAIKEGRFNEIYSTFLLEVKSALPTPESPDDVEGEWRVYTDKDIYSIMHAAEGTGWCVDRMSSAKEYTENGGQFHFFHLRDGETGVMSPVAVASIHVRDGVALEVSGLKGGSEQMVEDALVPTVYEKVKTFELGDSVMNKLVTVDNLRMLRVGANTELKDIAAKLKENGTHFRRIGDLLDAGLNVREIVQNTRRYDIAGAPDIEADILRGADNIDMLINAALNEGATVQDFYNWLEPDVAATYLSKLTKAGVDIDADALYKEMLRGYAGLLFYCRDEFVSAGVGFDGHEVLAALFSNTSR